MDKCWFILQQFYTPPIYVSPTKAGGKTAGGDLRLGDAVPSPKKIYPVLTQGTLPLFPRDMRISSAEICKFSWDTERSRETGGTVEAGAPIMGAIGATVNAELSVQFKKTMKNWASFDVMCTETVQPSRAYVDQVLAMPDVKDYTKRYWLPGMNQETIFVVTGLMIARSGGTVGSSEFRTHAFSGGPDVCIPDIVNAKLHINHDISTSSSISTEVQGDRVWAVRFAKIHKGLLHRKWMQTEVTVGAALDGSEEEEDICQVLDHEGIENAEVFGTDTIFVTGDF